LISKKIFSSEAAFPSESKLGRKHILYRGPSKDALYQVSLHLTVVSEEKNF
jgi:hypothetical protein